jgi:glycosyltransferase involved in cell wall biosynthesis
MNVLMLCEGQAEAWDSWSGISKSIVDQLRCEGHTVTVGDVDLYGPDRWAAAASTVSSNRNRWRSRYHLGAVPFWLRSRNARTHIDENRGRTDLIVQVGATFQPLGRASIPYCLCCDSNIAMARHGAASGFSEGTPLPPSDLRRIARREQSVYTKASAIFTLSERLRRSFVDDFAMPADRVRAIYAGPNIDLSKIPAEPYRQAPNRPPTILFVGRQFHRKGGDVLVESFLRVRTHLPDARLIIAGQGRGAISGAGISCIGNLDKNRPDEWLQLVQAYETADVFALPTRFEPFGIAFVEAMHFGLPCVGPDAWAVPEIIDDGETGFTVPVDDVDALADRLLRLLRNPELARSMGDAGRRRARQLFTWPLAVSRMLDVLAPIVAQNGRTH